MLSATELPFQVSQPSPPFRQGQLSKYQSVILEGGLKLLPRVSSAAKNTSHPPRTRRQSEHKIMSGKNSQNKPEAEKYNSTTLRDREKEKEVNLHINEDRVVDGQSPAICDKCGKKKKDKQRLNKTEMEVNLHINEDKVVGSQSPANCDKCGKKKRDKQRLNKTEMGTQYKLEENKESNIEGDDYEDDDNANDEEENDEDDTYDTYEEDDVTENDDTVNDENESNKSSSELKNLESAEVKKCSEKSLNHENFDNTDEKLHRINKSSSCTAKIGEKQKKLNGEATKKTEDIENGNYQAATDKLNKKQTKVTGSNINDSSVKSKGKYFNIEPTSQSCEINQRPDSTMKECVDGTKKRGNNTNEGEIMQKKLKSRDKNKTLARARDLCASTDKIGGLANLEKEKTGQDGVHDFQEKEREANRPANTDVRVDNQFRIKGDKCDKRVDDQYPIRCDECGKKKRNKGKKTKCAIDLAEQGIRNPSKSSSCIEIRHENTASVEKSCSFKNKEKDRESNESKNFNDDNCRGLTTAQKSEIRKFIRSKYNSEKGSMSTKGSASSKNEEMNDAHEKHEPKENPGDINEINSQEKPKKKKNDNNSRLLFNNGAKTIDHLQRVVQSNLDGQEEKNKALRGRIFHPSTQENLGEQETSVSVLPAESSHQNETLTTLLVELNECITSSPTAKFVTKFTTTTSDRRSKGMSRTLPDSKTKETTDPCSEGDVARVTRPEITTCFENDPSTLDVLRLKIESPGSEVEEVNSKKNKDTSTLNSVPSTTLHPSDLCAATEPRSFETKDESLAEQSVRHLSCADNMKLGEILKRTGNKDKNRKWLKHDAEIGKNTFKKPYQMYLNMLNLLTKKSARSSAKKLNDIRMQEQSSDQVSPKIALQEEATLENNIVEDYATDSPQVLKSQSSRPIMLLPDLGNSKSNDEISPSDEKISIDLMLKKKANERSLILPTDRKNLEDRMLISSQFKPRKASHLQFFRQRLLKEDEREKSKKRKSKKSKNEKEPSVYEDLVEERILESKTDDTNAGDLRMTTVGKPRSEIKALLHVLRRSKVKKSPKYCPNETITYLSKSAMSDGDGDSYNMKQTFHGEKEDRFADVKTETEEEELAEQYPLKQLKKEAMKGKNLEDETEFRTEPKKFFSEQGFNGVNRAHIRRKEKNIKYGFNADSSHPRRNHQTKFRILKQLVPRFVFKDPCTKSLDEQMNHHNGFWHKTVDLGLNDDANYSKKSVKMLGKKHKKVLLVQKKSHSHKFPDKEGRRTKESIDPVSALVQLMRSEQESEHNMLHNRQVEDDV
nr:PREDICTED: kinesin-related protein 4-like isoform X2 [Bemisia tabaci]